MSFELEVVMNLALIGIGWTCRIWWVGAVARRQESRMMIEGTLLLIRGGTK